MLALRRFQDFIKLAAALLAILWIISVGLVFRPGRVTQDPVERQLRWLAGTQLDSGAIALNPQKQSINPYFANFAALALLEGEAYRDDIRRYLQWYLAHLNRPDVYGLTGTIYDYRLEQLEPGKPPVEVSTGEYDSADSYAATFLMVVQRYLEVTGDRQFIEENLADLQLVAGVMVKLQDKDGLLWERPTKKQKFLMDNSEAFAGFRAWAMILDSIGKPEEAGDFYARAERVRRGVLTRMYRPRQQEFLWMIDGRGKGTGPNWSRWYPDAVAQLYPLLFGVVPPNDARAISVYQEFNRSHPGWPDLAKEDPFPWVLVAYSAAMMGEGDKARELLDKVSETYPQGEYPWYNMESAFYVFARRSLDDVPRSAAAALGR